MLFVVDVFGLRLEVSLSLPEWLVTEPADEEIEAHGGERLGSDIAFGFAPDPVFPDLIWPEEEERYRAGA